MANKRQRLARRHFVETQREAAQAKEAAPLSDSENKTALKPSNRKILKKHPLRVPGKKPGDGCFICKSSQHIAKAWPQKLGKDRKMGGSCKVCGSVTHLAKDCCPENDINRRPNGIQQGKHFISKEVAPTPENHAKRIVLRSGDDLEDDFIDEEGDESEGNKKKGSSKRKGQAQEQKGSQLNTWSSKPVVKKARNSPKFVNFKL